MANAVLNSYFIIKVCYELVKEISLASVKQVFNSEVQNSSHIKHELLNYYRELLTTGVHFNNAAITSDRNPKLFV